MENFFFFLAVGLWPWISLNLPRFQFAEHLESVVLRLTKFKNFSTITSLNGSPPAGMQMSGCCVWPIGSFFSFPYCADWLISVALLQMHPLFVISVLILSPSMGFLGFGCRIFVLEFAFCYDFYHLFFCQDSHLFTFTSRTFALACRNVFITPFQRIPTSVSSWQGIC